MESTVVKIFIPFHSFKPILFSLSCFFLFQNTQTSLFLTYINIFDSFTHTLLHYYKLYFFHFNRGVAVNKEFSIKRCKSVKKTKPCTGPECYPDMVAPCEVITAGASSSTYSIKANGQVVCNQLLWNCVRRSGHTLVCPFQLSKKNVFTKN